MAKNIIQFQKGLSLPKFLEKYGTEEQCYSALFHLRWPDGFVCPECGNKTYCEIKSRKAYQCHRCHQQTSLTSGTIFAATKVPLTKWFLAIYLLTQRKTSVSALQLKRGIGVSYNTAKRVFGLVKDFGASQSPKSTRPLTTYWCPSRPGHQALRNNFASSLLLRTWLPMTGRRVRRPTLFSLWRKARRENSAASRLLVSTSLRFALHGWQRLCHIRSF